LTVSPFAPLAGIGPFPLNAVIQGDCRERIVELPDEAIDVAITSPPYWPPRGLDLGVL
jgi:site-specific DNA-methyltransferase (adenine-specific)